MLSTRMGARIAFHCYLIVALVSLFTGSVYLLSEQIMPWHLGAIEVPWNALAPRYQVLLLAFLKLGGAGCFSLGVVICWLLYVPYRRREAWSLWAIPVIGVVYWVPVLYAGLTIRLRTAGAPPWYVNSGCIVLLIVGFVLTHRGLGARQG
jgi:hypothetical protein